METVQGHYFLVNLEIIFHPSSWRSFQDQWQESDTFTQEISLSFRAINHCIQRQVRLIKELVMTQGFLVCILMLWVRIYIKFLLRLLFYNIHSFLQH